MSTLFNILSENQQQDLLKLKTEMQKKSAESSEDTIINYFENWLLDDEQKQMLSLNSWNIFFLYASFYLFEINLLETSKSQQGSENRTNLLIHVSAGLKKQMSKLKFDDQQIQIITLIIASISKRNSNAEWLSGLPRVEYHGKQINMKLISSTLCLAMEFDLDHPVVLPATYDDLKIFETVNSGSGDLNRFREVFTIISVGSHIFIPGTIQVKILCKNSDAHRALKHHESIMQRLLHYVNSQVSPRYLFSDVIYEISADGYEPLDMKYSVDSLAALKLLTGNRLYSDKRVFLRELIQNAVDACNLNKIFDPQMKPNISIDFDSEYRTIKIKDNGIGMDRQWIEKYFLKIGISFYQSGDVKGMSQNNVDFNFISKFGIGFLSSFMVADKILIKTHKRRQPGLQITIANLQDYFDVRLVPEDSNDPDYYASGTEVTLYLSESNINYSRSMAYLIYLKTNIRYLTIPVTLFDHHGDTTILGNETLAYEKESKTGSVFIAPLEFSDSEGYVFLKAKQNLDTIYALESARGGISIFQDGIFVTRIDSLLPEGARQNIIGRINLEGKDRCELSMDRNRIFWTKEQLRHVKRTVRIGIVGLTNQLMGDTRVEESRLNIAQSVINHLAIFFDFNDVDDDMYVLLAKPVQKIVAKRFRDFVRVNFAHTGKNRNVSDADGYSEAWQQKILKTFAEKGRPPLPQ